MAAGFLGQLLSRVSASPVTRPGIYKTEGTAWGRLCCADDLAGTSWTDRWPSEYAGLLGSGPGNEWGGGRGGVDEPRRVLGLLWAFALAHRLC